MDKPKLILRADGNSTIGLGHIYRLLALADILKGNFYVIFVLYHGNDFIEHQIIRYCNEIIVLPGELPYKTPDKVTSAEEIEFDLNEILRGNEIVVLDGYYFGTDYQKAIKERGCKLICIDDLIETEFYADVVINHAPGVTEKLYKIQSYTKLLNGLDYAIIRQPFFKPIKTKAHLNQNRAFISLGGTDLYNYTEKLVGFLQIFKEFESLHVLCSSSFNAQMLDRLGEMQDYSKNILLYFNLNAEELVEVLDECTHAFVSASTVLMESYARGLKCFAGYYTINQKNMHKGFIQRSLACDIGDFRLLNYKLIAKAMEDQTNIKPLLKSLTSDCNIRDAFSSISLYN